MTTKEATSNGGFVAVIRSDSPGSELSARAAPGSRLSSGAVGFDEALAAKGADGQPRCALNTGEESVCVCSDHIALARPACALIQLRWLLRLASSPRCNVTRRAACGASEWTRCPLRRRTQTWPKVGCQIRAAKNAEGCLDAATDCVGCAAKALICSVGTEQYGSCCDTVWFKSQLVSHAYFP
jgi:hypothetical protein